MAAMKKSEIDDIDENEKIEESLMLKLKDFESNSSPPTKKTKKKKTHAIL